MTLPPKIELPMNIDMLRNLIETGQLSIEQFNQIISKQGQLNDKTA